MSLAERISRAEAAVHELSSLEELQRVAADLPNLIDEQRREQEKATAAERLEAERTYAGEALAAAAARGVAWRNQQLVEAVATIEALIQEYSQVQKAIAGAGWRLRSVVAGNGTGWQEADDGGPPSGLADGGDFAGEWRAIGGNSDDLDLFPRREAGSLITDLIELVERRSSLKCYRPARGARWFSRI